MFSVIMKTRIEILKDKRKQLGISLAVLAKNAEVPYSDARRVESGKIIWENLLPSFYDYWDDCVSAIEYELHKEVEQRELTQDLPQSQHHKKRKPRQPLELISREKEKTKTTRWSKKHDRCVKCGTTRFKHLARGLCKNCYHKHTENKHKDKNRTREYGSSSSILTRQYLVENYILERKSLSDIAKECDCSRQYIYKMIKSYGISPRKKDDARKIALDRGKVTREAIDSDGKSELFTLEKIKINESFFKSWTPEMAYVLGFIYADGNLNKKNPKFSISQKEPEILKKILKLMDCDAKIRFLEKRRYGDIVAGNLHWFEIANKKIYEDLIDLGLIPDKSLTVEFPNVPHKCVRHFIRGCWDGDGSVYIEKKRCRIGASFTSGSKRFIGKMVEELEKFGLKKRTIHITKRKNPTYSFRFSGSQCIKLYHYLYDNVPSTQYLERKYKIFNMYSNLYE